MSSSSDLRSNVRSVLLLGNYRPALAVARALNNEGYRVLLGLEGDEGGCELSQHVAETWDHPRLRDGDAKFFDHLERFLAARPDVISVFPVAEEFVNLFAAAAWNPPGGVALVGPGHGVVRCFADKIETLSLVQQLGVRTLPFDLVHDHVALKHVAARIGYPITVRPLGTTARLGHKKAVFAATPEELLEAVPVWPEGHAVLLLQRKAAGQRHNIYFAAHAGRLTAVCESRIRRTNHPEGAGLAVCGQTLPVSSALMRDTQTLVASQNYTGIGLAQFIVDPATGDRCFLELNPRVSGSHAVPEHAGVPLSVMAMDLAQGKPVKTIDPFLQGAPGLHYAWGAGDLMGAKLALIRGEIGPLKAVSWGIEALANAAAADFDLVWSWDDPRPGLHAMANILPKFSRARAAISVVWPWRNDHVQPASSDKPRTSV